MTQHLGFRCPDDLYEAIQKEIVESGKDRTTVIVEALKKGLGLPSTDLERKIAEMEARLNAAGL